MDANGDTQENYTLIGRTSSKGIHFEDDLYPVGVFHIPSNYSSIPVSSLHPPRPINLCISIILVWIYMKRMVILFVTMYGNNFCFAIRSYS